MNPGLVFLDRAHAALILVEAGELSVQDAITGLAPQFYELVRPLCGCARDMERLHPPIPPKPKTKWQRAAA